MLYTLHSFEDHIFLIVEQSSMCNTLNYEIRVTMIVIIQLCYNPFGLFCLYSLLVTKPLLCGTCLFWVLKTGLVFVGICIFFKRGISIVFSFTLLEYIYTVCLK